jgi:hypothetical protein
MIENGKGKSIKKFKFSLRKKNRSITKNNDYYKKINEKLLEDIREEIK